MQTLLKIQTRADRNWSDTATCEAVTSCYVVRRDPWRRLTIPLRVVTWCVFACRFSRRLTFDGARLASRPSVVVNFLGALETPRATSAQNKPKTFLAMGDCEILFSKLREKNLPSISYFTMWWTGYCDFVIRSIGLSSLCIRSFPLHIFSLFLWWWATLKTSP